MKLSITTSESKVFNEKAYVNDLVFLNYTDDFLVPALGGRRTLFSLDLIGSYKMSAVLKKLKSHNITPSLIPTGCTSLVQQLDVTINKPFKDIICELIDEAIFAMESVKIFHKWTVCDHCILTTTCIGDTFYHFHIERADIIECVFHKVSLLLPIDGSCDSELNIKGFTGLEIGNWVDNFGMIDEEAEIPEIWDNDEGIDFIPSEE
ncbi:hypothetical protein L873DRAFT_1881246 [Choiromyces venosus 120613-1]|uniref:DDE-1 domain-containing protein n=1 Tax=Choiromyces venosus 120613-1 TaxID=1336337 RepID=A0A3N4JV32_9PEZI|nr:hypothetical protein L873DRAFT_1881246 [Choiromyces venosus 120613-1]